MPQGSDYYQTQLRKDLRNKTCTERAFQEIEKLEKRVKDLELMVRRLKNRLDVLEGTDRKLHI